MKTKLKKIVSILTILLLLLFPAAGVQAFEIPDPPAPPEAPTAPVSPSEPSATEEKSADNQEPDNNQNTPDNQPAETIPDTLQPDTNSNGNVGDTVIDTGDGLAAGTLTAAANNNTALQESEEPAGSQTEISNTNNGSDSENSASANTESNTNIIQDNNANIGNSLDLDANTGESSASQNVGNSTIETGDANTSAAVVTAANTNIAGLAVSEFNIAGDTQGDLVLDFESGCILGCGVFNPVSATNTGNGSDSTNDAAIDQLVNNGTFQTNDATLENNVELSANSGYNLADKNTGGDSKITTGDANVSANVVNFLNNNIAGNIILGVVNIFGDLIGDIILPADQLNTPLASASNSGNGSDSTNTALIDSTTDSTTLQTNDALIENNLNFAATTGGNKASQNTGGDSIIETGEATVESQTINIANSNLEGGNWWLVLVNEAGQWAGRILGSEGSNMAGSEGTQFAVNPNGDITVTNQGNGAESDNTASVSQTNNTNTIQNNVAKIINNINLFANTGGNSASKNTGGNSTINTGDANVIANLVNFVNNNISGSGRLTITIVNVFGSWVGDFVTPGSRKETAGEPLPQSSNAPTASLSNQPSQTIQSSPAQTIANNTPPAPLSSSASSVSPNQNFSATSQTYVAGIEFEDEPANNEAGIKNKNKPIELNLAWLLLLMPLGGTLAVIKLRNRLIS